MNRNFREAIENRRSIYALSKESPVSNQDIIDVVEHSVKHVPSSFNAQSGRAVILFGEHHDKLWEITRETLRKIVPKENFASTNEKIDSFQNGYATILFFEDQAVIEGLQEMFPLYQDNFPIWSMESNGMLEFAVWTGLEDLGLGASLQHYNPLIDDEVKEHFKLPKHWKLMAEMPLGKPLAPAGVKEFSPLENRVKVLS